MACAILERTSGLEPSSETTAAGHVIKKMIRKEGPDGIMMQTGCSCMITLIWVYSV